MFAHRLRRRLNIKQELAQRFVSASAMVVEERAARGLTRDYALVLV